MNLRGCNCTVCTKKRRSFFEVLFWLLLTLIGGAAVGCVFWK